MRALLLLPLFACAVEAPDGRRGPEGDPGTTASPEPTETTVTVPTPDPWIDQGDGESQHVPCDPGQDTPLFYGVQGGFHVNVSGAVHYLGDVVWLGTDVYRASDGQRIGGSATYALLLAGFDTARQEGWFAGEQARLDDFAVGCALDGVEIEVCALVLRADESESAETCMPLVARMVERPAACDTL